MATVNVEQKIELHKLATEQVIAKKGLPKVSHGESATESEDKYLAFYEKIFNKLLELTQK